VINARKEIPDEWPSNRGLSEEAVGSVTEQFAASLMTARLNFADQLEHGIQEGLIHEMVGDIQRIKAYPLLGFQIPQDIPVCVWQAYEGLVLMGFDKHLIGAG
jgi:hypothetical protein